MTELGCDVPVVDLDEKEIVALRKLGYSFAKVGIAGGPDMQEMFGTALLSPDWKDLQKRGQKFGKMYRVALLMQGIEYRIPMTDALCRMR